MGKIKKGLKNIQATTDAINEVNKFVIINGVLFFTGEGATYCISRYGGSILVRIVGKSIVEEGTKIYRAVDVIEASSVSNTGKFLLQEGGTEVKYFAKTLEDAHWYGPKLYPNGYSVIEGTVKGSLDVSKYWYPNVDIGAFIFPQEALPFIIPK